jgi:hypothetical protein
MGGDGSLFVAWLEREKDGVAGVRVAKIAPDGRPLGGRVIAHTGAARSSGVPRIALAGDAVLVAWTNTGAATASGHGPGTPQRVLVARVPADLH